MTNFYGDIESYRAARASEWLRRWRAMYPASRYCFNGTTAGVDYAKPGTDETRRWFSHWGVSKGTWKACPPAYGGRLTENLIQSQGAKPMGYEQNAIDDGYGLNTGQPTNHGQSWSKGEEDLLVERLRAKWPIEAIASAHGRSVYAIECRIEAIADRPEREKRVKAAIAKILKGGKVKRK